MFRSAEAAEILHLARDTLINLDGGRAVSAITIKHASELADMPTFSFEQIAA